MAMVLWAVKLVACAAIAWKLWAVVRYVRDEHAREGHADLFGWGTPPWKRREVTPVVTAVESKPETDLQRRAA